MAEYYLIAQLPSLDGVSENTPLPMTEERFSELCHRFLGKKAQHEVDGLTLFPAKNGQDSGSGLVKAWNESERQLRLALAKVRAEKLKKSFDTGNCVIPAEYLKVASTAVEMENPMEAEKFLGRCRLELLEALRPVDNFSEDFVLYYGLKLKLLLRMRQFDTDTGEAVYRNIYNAALNMEAM